MTCSSWSKFPTVNESEYYPLLELNIPKTLKIDPSIKLLLEKAVKDKSIIKRSDIDQKVFEFQNNLEQKLNDDIEKTLNLIYSLDPTFDEPLSDNYNTRPNEPNENSYNISNEINDLDEIF